MNKKNLPYIDLYVGDWIKDCSILSCEAEGAWLRIVMKLHSKGKQSSIKIPTKSLQNLWSMNEDQMNLILKELELNEICDISYHTGFIELTSRRFKKQNDISVIRSKARKGVNNKKKIESNNNQKQIKTLQITDNDIDNDNDIDIDIINDNNIIPSFAEFWDFYDKKVNRPKCAIKWKALKQKERESIMNHLPNYIDSTPDKSFRKNPMTYLNNKSWEDEIINKKIEQNGLSENYKQRIISKLQS